MHNFASNLYHQDMNPAAALAIAGILSGVIALVIGILSADTGVIGVGVLLLALTVAGLGACILRKRLDYEPEYPEVM